jgi:hypothetical protein
MSEPNSQLERWFIAQHGPRVANKAPTDADLLEMVQRGLEAKEELTRRERWDAQWSTALYTRNASPDFKF